MNTVSRRSAVGLAGALLAGCASMPDAAPPSDGASAAQSNRILVFGASSSWGAYPSATGLRRIPFAHRWSGVAEAALGSGFEVVEDCMPGRTAGVDRPGPPSVPPSAMNGLKELPEAMMRNIPLHLVAIQLGTNDMLLDPSASAAEIAGRIGALADIATSFMLPYPLDGMSQPARALVLAPTTIGPTRASPNGPAAEARRLELLPALHEHAARGRFFLLDGAQAVPAAPPDGLHFDEAGHARLGALAAAAIRDALRT